MNTDDDSNSSKHTSSVKINIKKRILFSPEIPTDNVKRIRNENTETETTFIFMKSHHYNAELNATTEIQKNIGNDIKILGSKKVNPHGYLVKVYDSDLVKCFTEHATKFTPTKNTMNKKAYCVNKIDESVSIDDFFEHIQKALNQKIIYSTVENKLLLFLTENFKESTITNIAFQVNKKNYFIRNFDPITNYISQCKSCHKFNHTNCKIKKCRKCQKTDCNNECTENDLKCVNCEEKHSPYYKKCKAYLEVLKEAHENRKKKNFKSKHPKNRT